MLTQAANLALTNPPAIFSPTASFGTVTNAIEYGVAAILDDVTVADDEKSFRQFESTERLVYPFMQRNEVRIPPVKNEIAAINTQVPDDPDPRI